MLSPECKQKPSVGYDLLSRMLTKFEFKLTTGSPIFSAWRTADTRSRLDLVYKLVTAPDWPALAVRPTLWRKSTADVANSAFCRTKRLN